MMFLSIGLLLFFYLFYGHTNTIGETARWNSSCLVLHVAGPVSEAIQGVWTPREWGRSEAFTRKECLYSSPGDKVLPLNSVDGQDLLEHCSQVDTYHFTEVGRNDFLY
jgi:hypothetical protein